MNIRIGACNRCIPAMPKGQVLCVAYGQSNFDRETMKKVEYRTLSGSANCEICLDEGRFVYYVLHDTAAQWAAAALAIHRKQTCLEARIMKIFVLSAIHESMMCRSIAFVCGWEIWAYSNRSYNRCCGTLQQSGTSFVFDNPMNFHAALIQVATHSEFGKKNLWLRGVWCNDFRRSCS